MSSLPSFSASTTVSNQLEASPELNPVPIPSYSSNKIRFPFKLRLGLAICLLSMGLVSASVYWLYVRTHSDLMEDMAIELSNFGQKAAQDFTESDIQAIHILDAKVHLASTTLTEQQLAIQEPALLPGFRSPQDMEAFLKQSTYVQVAKKLGAITNRSRQDNSSDIFVMDSYIVTQIPGIENPNFLRILIADEGYRYQLSNRKADEAGSYYFPSSHALRAAFSGSVRYDPHFHSDPLYGDVITAAIPLKNSSGQVIAVLGLNVDVTSIAKQMRRLQNNYIHVFLASLICSILVAYLLTRWLNRPVQTLFQGAQQVRQHNFDVDLKVNTHDEFEALADAFNSMIAEVRHYTQNLEVLVDKRTTELNEAKQELENDLEKGQKMQRDFLPEPLLTIDGWEIVATFDPAKKVAGDFYDAFLLPGNLVGLVIADVCDKGVGAAMFMGLFRSFIRLFSGQMGYEYHLPDIEVLTQTPETRNLTPVEEALRAVEITNNYVSKEHSRTGMFATMFFGILDPETGVLTYINGGHESLFILGENGIKATLKATGPAVGMLPDVRYKFGQVRLDEGDILIGYTDGVTDARSPSQEFFSGKRLMTLLSHSANSASELIGGIRSTVFTHINGAPQFDDITMLGVQRQKSR